MDSKQRIVAARDGFLERKSKIIMVATFGALASLGVIAARDRSGRITKNRTIGRS